ncbi:hypothetical protein CPB83DRAFT_757078, partial [Crepidotus variabilis]
FICDCSAYDRQYIGHSLGSKTEDIKIVRAPVEPGKRGLVLVDTPGFDQLGSSDATVQQEITDLCYALYERGIVPKGVLYLFDISNNLSRRSYSAILALCKLAMPENLVIATTMWEQDLYFDQKEARLKQKPWNSLINAGALVERIWEHERPMVIRRIINMLTRGTTDITSTPISIAQLLQTPFWFRQPKNSP